MSIVSNSNPVPVELLRDGRGIYGIGVSDLFDYEAIARSCGIEPEAHAVERPPSALILRPDWFMETKPVKQYCKRLSAALGVGRLCDRARKSCGKSYTTRH
jgi:hypothetical protein